VPRLRQGVLVGARVSGGAGFGVVSVAPSWYRTSAAPPRRNYTLGILLRPRGDATTPWAFVYDPFPPAPFPCCREGVKFEDTRQTFLALFAPGEGSGSAAASAGAAGDSAAPAES
jgi:hypothetical protein